MPSIRKNMPLAAIYLLALALGVSAAPIASEAEYDCGGDGEAEAASTTVTSQVVTSSHVSVPTTISSTSSIPTIISVPTSSAVVSSAAKSTAVSSAASSASTGSSKSASTSDGTKYLMVFGDSYSSDGFSAASDVPTSALPLGIASPGTTTAGTGMNWVGMSATEFNTSLTFALDYAVYGATTDTSLVRGSTPDVVDQVAEFTADTETSSDVAWTATNTMAVFWIGINDVGNSYWDGVATPIDTVHDQYFAQMQILYDAGIRLFTLFTVPPFDQAPVFAAESVTGMDNMRSNITAYNADLTTRLATFEAANSGVTGTIFDTTDSFTTVLSDPTAYDATDATCMNSDGTTCLWYDDYHPGQAIHKLVSQNFVAALTGTFF